MFLAPPTPNITAYGISPYEILVSLDNTNDAVFSEYEMELRSETETLLDLLAFTDGSGNHTFGDLQPETTYKVIVRIRKQTAGHCQLGGGHSQGETAAETRECLSITQLNDNVLSATRVDMQ